MSIGNHVKSMVSAVLFMGLSCASIAPLYAGLKEGLEATHSKDYEHGVKAILQAAEAGSALAQRYAGYYYSVGWGIPKDHRKAFEWYLKAAENGDAESLAQASIYYFTGEAGVSKDCDKALRLVRQAASKGVLKAYQLLTRAYRDGVCAPQDPREAIDWATKAAELNDSSSQHFIGVQYWQGNGVKQNSAEAYKWFVRSASQGNGAAMVSLGMMHLGDGMPKDLVMAVTWLRLAQQSGVADNEKERLNKITAHWWQALRSAQQQEVERRIAAFKPHSLWMERIESERRLEIEDAASWDAKQRN